MSLQEAKQFVAHFVTGDYTSEEYATFLQWLRGAGFDELNAIADEHESMHENWSISVPAPSPEWVAMLEGKLDQMALQEDETPVRHVETSWVMRPRVWVAAASVAVVIFGGAIWYSHRAPVDKNVAASGHESVTPVLSQTMENPAGGSQKQLVLADGSKVWLNAATTLKYPAVFTASERVVELSGEAYFEVSKSADKPFRVQIKDAEVEVLGTHFNIMAYENEPISKTVLIDGAVRLESGAKQVTLNPGEQAVVYYPAAGSGAADVKVSKADGDAALAWRKGNIEFTDADLPTVMRALTRYYDIEIQYPQGIPESKAQTGSLIVQDGLMRNLEYVEGMFGVHLKKDGKIVSVTH